MEFDNSIAFRRHMDKAHLYYAKAEWELMSRELHEAKSHCEVRGFPDAVCCKQEVMTDLGRLERRYGRFEAAEGFLLEALAIDETNESQCVGIFGELAVVYRHRNNILKYKEMSEHQFSLANKAVVMAEAETCRAIGNLGTANYLLATQNPRNIDRELLHTAIDQLEDRIRKAQALRARLEREDPKSRYIGQAKTWESIGWDRLSLCHIADGDTAKAVNCSEHSQARHSSDPTVRAFSRFFHGYALLCDGQRDRALEQFSLNAPNGECAPVEAVCKEPSDEHRGFLQVLVDNGANLDHYDEQGFSALEYAVFGNDKTTKAVIINGFSSKELEPDEIEKRQTAAILRKHYREIFQQHVLPHLRLSRSESVQSLRRAYADLLNADEEKQSMFDSFKFVHYQDFINLGRLPRSEDELVREFSESDAQSRAASAGQYVIFFFSYRWIGRTSNPLSDGPDDSENTQYLRMLKAIGDFLEMHPEVTGERLNIWLDCACIDQVDEVPDTKKRVIDALPLLIAQCDAMISLVDDHYFDRAWCAVEVLLMETLKKSYGRHQWYEHRLLAPDQDRTAGFLQQGTADMGSVDVAHLQVSQEEDRPHIAFLLRQSRLLGKC